jgi:hypothetical protein
MQNEGESVCPIQFILAGYNLQVLAHSENVLLPSKSSN